MGILVPRGEWVLLGVIVVLIESEVGWRSVDLSCVWVALDITVRWAR